MQSENNVVEMIVQELEKPEKAVLRAAFAAHQGEFATHKFPEPLQAQWQTIYKPHSTNWTGAAYGAVCRFVWFKLNGKA